MVEEVPKWVTHVDIYVSVVLFVSTHSTFFLCDIYAVIAYFAIEVVVAT